MDKSKFEHYVSERYKTQIRWYSNRASANKQRYHVFQWTAIILSVSLPVLIATVPDSRQLFTIVISIVLAICTAALKTFKFQENWINYRTTAETLKKEKYFLEAELNEYADATDKEALFIERVESLISRENTLWVTTHTRDERDEKKKSERTATAVAEIER